MTRRRAFDRSECRSKNSGQRACDEIAHAFLTALRSERTTALVRSDTAHIRTDGTGVRTVAISDLAEHPGVDLAAYEGASSGRLDIDDLATIGDDSVAVVVVLENVWVLGMVDRWSRSGVRLIIEGAVPTADLLGALNAAETN